MNPSATAALLLLGLALLFAVRSSYRYLVPTGAPGDAWGQLLQIADIREAGHRRPERPSAVVTSGHYAYPYFVLWLLSFLPERPLMWVERHFSGLSDVVYFGVVSSLYVADVLALDELLLVLVVFVATPQFMRPDLAHGRGLSSRKPGVILTTVSLLTFVTWLNSGGPTLFAVSVLAGALMCLTSKFSLQAYVAVLLPMAAFVHWSALTLVPLAIVVAAVLSTGRYLRILRGHVSHVYDYATEKQYKMFSHDLPNPVRFVRAVLGADSMRDVLEVFNRSRRLRPLVDNPFIVATIVGVALGYAMGEVPVPRSYLVWIAGGVAAFVLTSLPHLLFLGQAERYLEYVFLPSSVLLARGWSAFGPGFQALMCLVVAGGILVELTYVWGYRNVLYSPDRREAIDDVADYLSRKPSGVLLAQPTNTSRELAWKTGHRVVEFVGGNGTTTEESVEELNTLYPDRYGYVTGNVAWLHGRFNPGWVVFDLEKLREADPDEVGLTPPDADPDYENNLFEVYRFDAVVPDG
jgi:hypothetical protein